MLQVAVVDQIAGGAQVIEGSLHVAGIVTRGITWPNVGSSSLRSLQIEGKFVAFGR
jgi:hypothetical protein